jgi:hypothetical protein
MTNPIHQRSLRYGEFLGAVRVKQRRVSYKDVHADAGLRPRVQRLRLIDVHRLLTPYVSVRFLDQLRAVVPLALFLALFQIAALRADVEQGEMIAFGMLAVMLGLMLFMDGVKYGLMPFSESIGFNLPNRATPARWCSVLPFFSAALRPSPSRPSARCVRRAAPSTRCVRPGCTCC